MGFWRCEQMINQMINQHKNQMINQETTRVCFSCLNSHLNQQDKKMGLFFHVETVTQICFFFHVNKESLKLANAYGQDWVTHICCLWLMMIYDCFRNSIHVNTDVPKPHARLCFKHMLFHMMLMHRYFLPRTHKPLVDEWLGGLVCRFVRSFMFRPRFRCLYLLPLELPSHIYIYIYKHTCYLIYIYIYVYIYILLLG